MLRLTQIAAVLLVLLALLLGVEAWRLGTRNAAAPAEAVAPPVVAVAETFPVVVARRKVAAGETLAADALQVARLPIDPPGAIRDVAAAIGRVPVADLEVGALLMEAGLAAGLALRLADGERAVAIRADEVLGVANRVRPGDFVDVFVVFRTDGREIARSQSRLLLSRLRVLAYGGASVDGPPAEHAGTTGGTSATRPAEPARTAVLAVPVEDVARLALGEGSGRLLLALRHPGDNAVPGGPWGPRPPAGATPVDQAQAGFAATDLSSGATAPPVAVASVVPAPAFVVAPAPVARPASMAPSRPRAPGIDIEVIRGDQRETATY